MRPPMISSALSSSEGSKRQVSPLSRRIAHSGTAYAAYRLRHSFIAASRPPTRREDPYEHAADKLLQTAALPPRQERGARELRPG